MPYRSWDDQKCYDEGRDDESRRRCNYDHDEHSDCSCDKSYFEGRDDERSDRYRQEEREEEEQMQERRDQERGNEEAYHRQLEEEQMQGIYEQPDYPEQEPEQEELPMPNNHPARLWLEVCSKRYVAKCNYESKGSWEPEQKVTCPKCNGEGCVTCHHYGFRFVSNVEDLHLHCVGGHLHRVGEDTPFTELDDGTCPQCNENGKGENPGKRTVRLVGLVPVNSDCDEEDCVFYTFTCEWGGRGIPMYDSNYNQIIADRYHAGTLPPELLQSETNPNGLREIPCDPGATP